MLVADRSFRCHDLRCIEDKKPVGRESGYLELPIYHGGLEADACFCSGTIRI
jgi:hypothetical protein